MASSGSFTTTSCEGRSLKFSWSIKSQSVANNTTTISWSLTGAGSYTAGYVICGGFKVVINGSTVYSKSTDYRVNVWSGTTIASGTHTIAHNNNGTKSFSASAQAGIYTYAVNCSGSGSWSLTTIPRASSISAASNVTLGNKCSIKWTPASSNFKYKIKFALGSWSYTTGFISPSTTSAYTYTGYTIPSTSATLSQIPNSTTGTMTATLTTYNSGGTQIGSSSSKTFTVTVPIGVVPTVGTITLNPADINGQNILVQGKNKLVISVSGWSAGTGSSIKTYTFSGPGISETQTGTSVTCGPVSKSGTLTYTVKVTDNRGRTASKTATITCYAWSAPSITLNAYRVASSTSTTENDSGTYVRCTYSLSYASVNNTNDVTVKILYKKNTASGWSSVAAITDSTSTSGNKTLSSIDAASTYTVYATITDNYGGSSSSTQVMIFSADRVINITKDGTGVAFGKMAESNSLLESRYKIKAPGITSSRGTRPTNITLSPEEDRLGCLEYYLADVSALTDTDKPPADGHVLHFHWDGTNGYDSQLYLRNSTGATMSRGCSDGTWGSWRTHLDSSNYTSYVTQKPTSLYSSSSGTNGTITLSSSAANFTYLEIFYTDNNGKQGNSVKIYSPNGKYVSLSCIEPSTSGSEPRVYIRTSGWTISGTSMTVGRTDLDGANRGVYGQFYPNANGTNSDVKVTANNYIKIFRILGYK